MSAVLQKTTVPASPSTSAMSVRERLVHPRFKGLSAIEARLATPMGRTGTDFITLTLPCVRTRPAGKTVRLRLDFFDARSTLSGSVIRYATDTSSDGERRRETVTAGVPLLCTPSLPDSQRGIAPLALRSQSCRAYTLQRLQFLRCGCGISADCAEPIRSRLCSRLQSLRLHSVIQAPSAGPAHTSEVRYHSTKIQPSVPEPERPSSIASTTIPSGSCRACRLACSLSGRQKERCFRIALPDFLRVERWDEPHAPSSVHNRTASHVRSEYKDIFISYRKHSRASATRFIRIVFRFDILVTAINTLYATYVVKTCNALSPYA